MGVLSSSLLSGLRSRSDVHLWVRRLDLDAELLEGELAVLGADERSRAKGFRFAADRRRFVRRHLHLRTVLASYLGSSPERVPLETPLHEPPWLGLGDEVSELRFSLSSSGDHAAVAVAWRRPVGVDIERIDPAVEIDAVARTVFSPAERCVLDAAPAEERGAFFFRIWTRKEAYVKARGTGLARDLMSFDVLEPGNARGQALVIDRLDDADEPRWRVQDVPGPPAFALACAGEGEDWSLVSKER